MPARVHASLISIGMNSESKGAEVGYPGPFEVLDLKVMKKTLHWPADWPQRFTEAVCPLANLENE